jgi:predicted SprT family Zn-dependent metalloprotease
MTQTKQYDLKCERCGEFHTRLVVVHSNDAGRDTYECLDCVAELLIGRGQHGDKLIGASTIKNAINNLEV